MKSASQIQQLQSFELQLFELFASAISNHHMIDVGAHHGDTLRPFVDAGWIVDAFEPIEPNRNTMKDRFSTCQNLVIHPEAVSNSSGYKDFHLALKQSGDLHEYYHSLERIGVDSHHSKGGSVRIQTVALDDLVRAGRLPSRIGFLKVDAEGHDLAVLEGASLLLADVISVEFWSDHHPLGKSPSPLPEMATLLDARGYKIFIILCRQGEAVECRDSISSIPSDSWGNAIFFRDEHSNLARQCADLLQASSPPSNQFSRLPGVVRSCLPKTAFTFIDVGAYLGDFSHDVLEDFPSATGLLFEPTELSFQALERRFQSRASVRIFNLALSSEAGERKFNTVADSATNSLLGIRATSSQVKTTFVRVATLDGFLEGLRGLPSISLLKVDTQGNDLRVLEGAKGILAAHRPAVLVEAIFLELYQGQSAYYDILEFMRDRQYSLAAVLAPHATSEGIWAFADLLFVPAEQYRSLVEEAEAQPHYLRIDIDHLLAQNRMLQSACDERLELIHRLNATAEERLKVIEILDAEVKRLSGKRRGS